jgi:hypothetical protein
MARQLKDRTAVNTKAANRLAIASGKISVRKKESEA